MPHPLVMGLFENLAAAASAARELRGLGIDPADLSVVARDHQDEETISQQIDASPGSELEDSPTAARLGELSGYVLAAIAIGLPGTGAVVAAGPLAAELGEAAGHVAGDLKSTLIKAGLTDAEADDWRTRVERGDAILLGAHARSVGRGDVERVMQRHGMGRVVETEWDD
jgi:hypothetical protein